MKSGYDFVSIPDEYFGWVEFAGISGSREVNFKFTGKRLSHQVWGISEKVRLDLCLKKKQA